MGYWGIWVVFLTIRLLPLTSSLYASVSGAPLPPVFANQNHVSAGQLRDGILTVHLEIAKGAWHPEADDGISLGIYVFGESGHPLQNPGPLIRVPLGTEVQSALHNTLSFPISVHGLSEPGSDAVVRVGPGATEQVRFKATTPGLYFYWGAVEVSDLKLRYDVDAELTGALVVDPPAESPNDEIFVIEMMSEVPGLGAGKTLATINGKSWPYTERFEYKLGQPVRWRWINATNEPHALHLHGFYYRIDAFNHEGRVQTYVGESRPSVVTQRIAQGDTFDMSWSPSRPGNWLFHCHMLLHMNPPIIPNVPGLTIEDPSHHSDEHMSHTESAMGQLVLGITVPGTVPQTEWRAEHKVQLEISEHSGAPRYGLRVREEGAPWDQKQAGLIGPPIVITRGQATEIEVVNKTAGRTAIHWHGMEIESYYDGVPGWSGAAKDVTPAIEPGASFVARMVPPRDGTFIYHTHWHDELQLTNGVYGPLIVLPAGEKFDPASDIPFVFSIGNFGALGELALINGSPQNKTLPLQAGKKYRFRFINISTNNQGMQVSLSGSSGPVNWTVIAKDGLSLPVEALQLSKARLTITVGETYDVEFTSPSPQDLLLELLLPGQKIHIDQTLAFAAPK